MDKTCTVSEVEASSQLDCHVVNQFKVRSGYVDGEVEALGQDVLVHIASICQLAHRVVDATVFFHETVECCNDVGMGLKVDPLVDDFVVGDLPGHELLSEVLVVQDEGGLTEDCFDLNRAR